LDKEAREEFLRNQEEHEEWMNMRYPGTYLKNKTTLDPIPEMDENLLSISVRSSQLAEEPLEQNLAIRAQKRTTYRDAHLLCVKEDGIYDDHGQKVTLWEQRGFHPDLVFELVR
jgi:hypothetical protein